MSVAAAAVLDALNTVQDPELGIGLVDLGLIYDVEIKAGMVRVTMTFTVEGCPMGESIEMGVRRALLALPGVLRVEVQVTWTPPWRPEFIDPRALAALNQREEA
jgi:metal-sulfur cluster biosynthetic enzyme